MEIEVKITWMRVMPHYIFALESGNKKERNIAKEELMRLAEEVDKANENK